MDPSHDSEEILSRIAQFYTHFYEVKKGEGWPALNQAGDELWFTRNYAIWKSKSVNGEWQPADLIVSPLAGEPSLDENGNLYFVHHYYHDDTMIEADIYVAYKR